MGNTKEWLTVQEAAALSGLAETTIRSALLRGRLPFENLYGRNLIKPADLATYQAEAKRGRPRKEK